MRIQIKTIAAALVAAVFITACGTNRAANVVPAEDTTLSGNNPCPAVIPSIQEWKGGDGTVAVTDNNVRYEIVDDDSLGEEGYRIDIGCGKADENEILVYANTDTGLYWGRITVEQMKVLAGDSAEIARGRIRDYPIGKVRGLMLDVGRNTMSLSQIYQIARNLSLYKMNELTLHLQDNALLTYSDKTDHVADAYGAYSAFRMESSITNDDGDSITADDMSYSAEDLAQLIQDCAEIGVSIIPEIDTPAHSLALTTVFPELGLNGRPDSVDMLDCSNPDALALVEQVWDEQLETAFADATTIQIGGDEYYGQAVDFINFEQGLIGHLQDKGKTLRMWGSLTALKGDSEISSTLSNGEKIQMQLWSTYWADPLEMYEAGFDLINSSSDKLYINCGEASDYLDKENLYNNYTRTEYAMADGTTETLPESDQLIGSSAALWNDLIDNLEIGICEYDMTDRVLDALPVLGEIFWNEDGARTYEEFAADAEAIGTEPESDPLHRNEPELVGPDYTMRYEVYLPSDAAENADYTIFRVERDGNTYEFTARNENGRVGFSREFCDYEFDYEMPTDEWVQMEVVGHKDVTELYINGELVDSLGSSEPYEEHATFLFPTTINENFAGEVRSHAS